MYMYLYMFFWEGYFNLVYGLYRIIMLGFGIIIFGFCIEGFGFCLLFINIVGLLCQAMSNGFVCIITIFLKNASIISCFGKSMLNFIVSMHIRKIIDPMNLMLSLYIIKMIIMLIYISP